MVRGVVMRVGGTYHFRATIKGLSMVAVDSAMREAKIGAVTSSDVDNVTNASGTPVGAPEQQSVTVTVQADDEAEAERRLDEVLPSAGAIEVLG